MWGTVVAAQLPETRFLERKLWGRVKDSQSPREGTPSLVGIFDSYRGEESRGEEILLLLSWSFSFSETFSFPKKKKSENSFIKLEKISRYFHRRKHEFANFC